MSDMYVKKLVSHAIPPARKSEFAAGYDLTSSKSLTVPARGKELIPTGISVKLPDKTYGRIAPRSGLAWKHYIDVGAGVIDADYRGEIFVLLFNHADTDFEITAGDRVAQLILECIKTPPVVLVDELAETDRGAGGFGSTGSAN